MLPDTCHNAMAVFAYQMYAAALSVRADFPNQLLLLHVRPRRLAAGLEIAVYSGSLQDEEASTGRMDQEGTVYAVPRTQAGLEQFAADLAASGPETWNDYSDYPAKLPLPTKYNSWECGWSSVGLDLLPPSAVRSFLHVSMPCGKQYTTECLQCALHSVSLACAGAAAWTRSCLQDDGTLSSTGRLQVSNQPFLFMLFRDRRA